MAVDRGDCVGCGRENVAVDFFTGLCRRCDKREEDRFWDRMRFGD